MYGFCHGHSGRKIGKDMCVIKGSADGKSFEFILSRYASHVRPQVVPNWGSEERFAVVSAEDDVGEKEEPKIVVDISSRQEDGSYKTDRMEWEIPKSKGGSI